MLIVAGAYGADLVKEPGLIGNFNPVEIMFAPNILGEYARWAMLGLAVASFAPACFPAMIAANSFKSTMPRGWKIAVVLGTLIAIALSVTGIVREVVSVFAIVGASFGPICGAMLADYLLAGCKWPGPRAAFNPAGWISWAVGFYLGAVDLAVGKLMDVDAIAQGAPWLKKLAFGVPCPAMTALIAGFLVYLILAKIGLQSKSLEMPDAERAAEGASE